jgi:CRISPR-associated protein Csb2
VLAFRIRYLLGRVAAADFACGNDKNRVEWPPHPDRLLCALVQAWGDLGCPPAEHELLLRLQSPLEEPSRLPVVHVGTTTADADVARVSFVPVNDNEEPFYRDPTTKRDKPFSMMGAMRIGRDRKERRFVSRTVDLNSAEPHAIIGWPGDGWVAQDYDTAARLARMVGYLGHSSSVVAVDVTDAVPPPTWVGDEHGTLLLRVPTDGRVEALERAFQAGHRPPVGVWRPYGRPKPTPVSRTTPWSDMVVFRLVGGPHRLPLVSSVRATRRLRECLMDVFREIHGEDAPEVVSGRAPAAANGDARTRSPHLAFVPLPDTGHYHARGHLLGLAILLLRDLNGEERLRVLKAIAPIKELDLGTAGRWTLERQTLEANVQGLLPGTWTGPAKIWATVTPMAFDTDPGDPFGAVARRGVALACTRVGLPEPSSVALAATPFLPGVEHAREFPLFRPTLGAPCRRHTHVRLEFDEIVQGPVAIGSGRYLGHGLCRPMPYGE